MALINCPECNKEISDKASSCPNCGYPIQEQIFKSKPSSTKVNICPKCGHIWGNYKKCQDCGTKLIDCNILFDDYEKMDIIKAWEFKQEMYNKYVIGSSEFDETLFNKTYKKGQDLCNAYKAAISRPSAPTINCPYCKSTNTKKIGVISRSVSIGLFGLGSKKINKQWHCNHCGSDF